jgi:hypothetical protein
VLVVELPAKLPVIILAEKFPEESLATIALAVLEELAVVAEFDTFPELEIVRSLESDIDPASIALVTTPLAMAVLAIKPVTIPERGPVKLMAVVAESALPCRLPINRGAVSVEVDIMGLVPSMELRLFTKRELM